MSADLPLTYAEFDTLAELLEVRVFGVGTMADARRDALVKALDALGCPKHMCDRHERRVGACEEADKRCSIENSRLKGNT